MRGWWGQDEISRQARGGGRWSEGGWGRGHQTYVDTQGHASVTPIALETTFLEEDRDEGDVRVVHGLEGLQGWDRTRFSRQADVSICERGGTDNRRGDTHDSIIVALEVGVLDELLDSCEGGRRAREEAREVRTGGGQEDDDAGGLEQEARPSRERKYVPSKSFLRVEACASLASSMVGGDQREKGRVGEGRGVREKVVGRSQKGTTRLWLICRPGAGDRRCPQSLPNLRNKK